MTSAASQVGSTRDELRGREGLEDVGVGVEGRDLARLGLRRMFWRPASLDNEEKDQCPSGPRGQIQVVELPDSESCAGSNPAWFIFCQFDQETSYCECWRLGDERERAGDECWRLRQIQVLPAFLTCQEEILVTIVARVRIPLCSLFCHLHHRCKIATAPRSRGASPFPRRGVRRPRSRAPAPACEGSPTEQASLAECSPSGSIEHRRQAAARHGQGGRCQRAHLGASRGAERPLTIRGSYGASRQLPARLTLV